MRRIYKIAVSVIAVLGPALWLAAVCVLCPPTFGWYTAAIIVGAIAAFPVSVALHECGHMLFGALARIRAVPQFKIFGSSECKIIPRTDKNLRGRLMLAASGGLAVNALVFVASLIPACISREWFWSSAFAPACWYLLIVNGFPAEYASGKTDGLVICGLISNDDEAKVTLAVLTVQAQVLNGKPIEDVDESLLSNLPQIKEDDASFIALTRLRYEYYAAKGITDKAQAYKERLSDLEKYL